MDNAAAINQQIDEAIKDLKGRGYGAHWFPDSYGKWIRFIVNFYTFLTFQKNLKLVQF